MKKLLCVLMFGMMFGQTELTTREYIIPVNLNNDIVDILELTNTNLKFYSVRVYPDIDKNNDPCTPTVKNSWGSGMNSFESLTFNNTYIDAPQHSAVDDFYIINDGYYDERTLIKFSQTFNNPCEITNVHFWVTANFPQEETGYIEDGFDYCLHTGANLVSSPCRDEVAIESAIPSDILQNITGIITEGGAASNLGGNWVGSLNGLGGGK